MFKRRDQVNRTVCIFCGPDPGSMQYLSYGCTLARAPKITICFHLHPWKIDQFVCRKLQESLIHCSYLKLVELTRFQGTLSWLLSRTCEVCLL